MIGVWVALLLLCIPVAYLYYIARVYGGTMGILIGVTVFSVAISIACAVIYHVKDWDIFEWVAVISGAVGTLLVLIVAVSAIFWEGARFQAQVINRTYGTSYTQEEVFYAKSVIEEVRSLERMRIEINGDINREKSGE